MNLRPRRMEDPEINLISLIDVVLMLVIFFMLSSTFVDEGRMKVQLPTASEAPQPAGSAERIVVTVTELGRLSRERARAGQFQPRDIAGAVLAVSGKERARSRGAARRCARHAPGRGHRHGRAGQDGVPADRRGDHPGGDRQRPATP